jgi:hypothetical protein
MTVGYGFAANGAAERQFQPSSIPETVNRRGNFAAASNKKIPPQAAGY